MGRNARDNRPRVKPLIKVELSEKNKKARIIALVIFIAIAIISFTVFLFSLFEEEDGWNEIEAQDSMIGLTDEIVLTYNLGASEASASSEHKAIQRIYSEILVKAHKLFNLYESFDGFNNLYYINRHIGEEIVVDELLYDALTLIKEYNENLIYLEPVYSHYEELFMSEDDVYAKDLDAYYSVETEQYFSSVIDFASDRSKVSLELLDGCRVRLNVSEDYKEFAIENSITSFIGIANLRNAFIVDEVAEALLEKNYRYGSIVTSDGYMRNLDGENRYSYNIFDKQGNMIYTSSTIDYKGDISLVMFKDYPFSQLDYRRLYQYGDGVCATLYLDTETGKYKSAVDTFYAYSYTDGCAEVALKALPLYANEELDTAVLNSFITDGLDFVWHEGSVVRYTDSDINVNLPYTYDEVSYSKEFYPNS